MIPASRSRKLQRIGQLLYTTLLLACLLAGCTVGPNYKRPAVNSPDAFRAASSDSNVYSGINSFADSGWWDVYNDPQLKAYIGEALTNNWDIKIAAARVL